MNILRLLQYGLDLAALVYAIHLVRIGLRRRHAYWTRASWIRFVAVCGVGLGAILGSLVMANAVDNGIYSSAITSSNGRTLWFLAMMALVIAGTGILIAAIGWFGMGDPARAFPGASRDQPG